MQLHTIQAQHKAKHMIYCLCCHEKHCLMLKILNGVAPPWLSAFITQKRSNRGCCIIPLSANLASLLELLKFGIPHQHTVPLSILT